MDDGLQTTVTRQDIFNFLRSSPNYEYHHNGVNAIKSRAAASVGPSSQPVHACIASYVVCSYAVHNILAIPKVQVHKKCINKEHCTFNPSIWHLTMYQRNTVSLIGHSSKHSW